jgi:hypothetical protein
VAGRDVSSWILIHDFVMAGVVFSRHVRYDLQ